jgi:hypothetical protein
MNEIQLPNALLPITPENYGRLRRKNPISALVLFNPESYQPSIDIFRKPFSLGYSTREKSFGVCSRRGFKGMREDNVGWYLRKKERKKQRSQGGSLWATFSDELNLAIVEDSLKNQYGLRCSQTFATSAQYFGIGEKSIEPFFLRRTNSYGLTEVMDYLAKRTLGVFEEVNFSEGDIKKVSKFFYEDFTTLKHSKVSRGIGQEADSIFFS